MQTLGAVALILHATIAYTGDTSIIVLSLLMQLGYSLVSCLVLHVVGDVYIYVCTHYI